MPDTYADIRGIIQRFIQRAYPGTAAALDADSGHGEFTAPLGYAAGLEAGECARRLAELNALRPPLFLGEELIGAVAPLGNHVCFRLTNGAYSAAVKRTVGSYAMPRLPDDTALEADYALARMIMLSRQGGEGCPDDPRVRAALWLCLGIEGFGGAKREAMRRRAARAALDLLEGRPYPERETLRQSLGQAAGCAARLLALPRAARR